MSRSKELIKLPPIVLYEIASDIQVSEMWKHFAFEVGFSNENIIMMEMSTGDRFPAENVMYHWFSKNPKVDQLAKILCNLELEKPLDRLKEYMTFEKYKDYKRKLQQSREIITYQEEPENVPLAENVHRLNSNTYTDSTSVSTIPEAGLINTDFHGSTTVPRSSLNEMVTKPLQKIEDGINDLSIFQSILFQKSTKFSVDEFAGDDIHESLQGKMSTSFRKKLRGNMFFIKSYSLPKISEDKRKEKKLFNVIWSMTNFRFTSIPILSGYCFKDDHLFLIYPNFEMKSLFDILHRPYDENVETISSKSRLDILKVVGESLSFLHCSHPFMACHGHIDSHNVLVGTNRVLISGFENFYTEDSKYLDGLKTFGTLTLNIESHYRKEIRDYLQLICETWWNVPPYHKKSNSSLISDIVSLNITNPRVIYSGFNSDAQNKIRSIIEKYSSETKIVPKIEEIVDDLMSVEFSSDPPSYKEIEPEYVMNMLEIK